MTEPPPAPLVSANVDLKDYPFMPVDIVRLFGSEFHARSNDSAWRAGMTLWLKSYHQVPAASLPDDDVALARLAEFGRDIKSWRKVRSDSLYGWVKCSDGRLYHPVVAEKALEGWIEKLTQRKSSEAGNAKRYGHDFDAGPIDDTIGAAMGLLATLNPNSRTLRKRALKPPAGSQTGVDRSPTGSPADLPDGSQEKLREGKGRDTSSLRSDVSRDEAFEKFIRVYPKPIAQDAARRKLDEVLDGGVPLEDVLAGAERYARAQAGNEPRYIMAPDRWLDQARWTDGIVPGQPAPKPNSVFIKRDDPRWEHFREMSVKRTGHEPGNIDGGAWFLAKWAPQTEVAA